MRFMEEKNGEASAMTAIPVKICALLAALLAAGAAAFAEEKTAAGVRFTSLCVTAAGRSFRYARSGAALTVNGAAADGEVVDTLLRHLSAALSGEEAAFTPEKEPIMTVTFEMGGDAGQIAFYTDDDNRAQVYVISAGNGASVTEAWRVGTILLACEGSRAAEEPEEDR